MIPKIEKEKDKMKALHKAALLTLLPSLPVIHSCTCMFAFQDAFDIHLDHHEFAYYLDDLRSKGLLEISKSGGRIEYKLVK